MENISKIFIILIFIFNLSGCSSLTDLSVIDISIVTVVIVIIIGCLISNIRTGRDIQESVDSIMKIRREQLEKAKTDLRPGIDEGNPVSQYLLALKFHTGDGVGQDLAAACYWYSLSAESGFMQAVTTLALMYIKGWGTKQDLTKAVNLLSIASKEGDLQAQNFLAAAYLNGWGVRKNEEKARYWLQQAAAQSSEEASEALNVLSPQSIESLTMVIQNGDEYIVLK
jgi:TPR repeat protein